MIIGICGFIGSGKDTVADYLVNLHGFRKESFACSLKDAVSYIFGWDRLMLEGRTKQSRAWREQRDDWWSDRLGIEITPRWVLQQWGTDLLRKHFHDDIWIASLENKLRNSTDDVVISDCRFPNEIAGIKAMGGSVIRIKRGPDPEWTDYARSFMKGPKKNLGWALAKHYLDNSNIHPSEYSWLGTTFDHVFTNDGTLEELYNQVNNLLLDLHAAKLDQAE